MKRDTLKWIAAVLLLLCVPFAAVAFDSSALPGPAGSPAFTATGGTVTQPAVFTGDNSGGTGTVRIRPSDEDAQLVLCEAGNNASPEVCGSVQHANFSTALTYTELADNAYIDSAGSIQRYNTAFGIARSYAQTGSTNSSNAFGMNVWSTNATQSGDWTMAVTGAGTSTITVGATGTVTNDFRGPITNGGSATCQGVGAGSVCISDEMVIGTAGTTGYHYEVSVVDSSTTGLAGISLANSGAGGATMQLIAAGASLGDTDYNARAVYYSDSTGGHAIVSGVDRGVTTEFFRVMDNTATTGVTQLSIYGGGTIAYPQTQTVTCADNGGGTNATQTLDPQAHTITILNNDATGCDVTMQETSAIIGAVAVICVNPASTATNVNLADVANVFNGAAPALSQGDCITIRYFDAANDLWLQTGASNN